uniref:Tc1-like transposase DDE domain-containing protein n=1 Tax=Hucho hucho TaxID=62062 RepID=A0A4W5RC16_9TELE
MDAPIKTIIPYTRTMTQHTSRLCKGYLTKKERDGVLHQMTWPPQTPDLNPIEMVKDELDSRVKEKQPTSAQHMWELLQDCWKSIPGTSVVVLVAEFLNLQLCQAVSCH